MPGQLVENGGFEWLDGDRPAGWRHSGPLAVTDSAHGGRRAALLSADAPDATWMDRAAPVEGGQWYAASAAARIAFGTGEATLRVAWYAQADGSGQQLGAVDGSTTSAEPWAMLSSGPVQAPAEARSARVRLLLRSTEGRAIAAFDDVVLVVTLPPPTPTPTSTPTATPTPTPTPAPTPTPEPQPSPTPTEPPTPAPVPTATATPTPTPSPTAEAARASGTIAAPSATPTPTATPAPTVRVEPGPLTLRLSEVLADAAEPGLDRAHEWVELVNVGDKPVNTAGWSIGDGGALDPLPAAEVPPDGFLVVAGAAAVLPAGVPIVRLADGAIGAGLRNEGDAVRLVSPAGALVDAISWGDDGRVFAPPLPAASAGATLAAHGHGEAPERGRWGLTLGPSPGASNRFAVAADAGDENDVGADETEPEPEDPLAGMERAPPPTVRFERGGGSATPWVVLGAAAGAGTTLTLAAFASGARALNGRRRGR